MRALREVLCAAALAALAACHGSSSTAPVVCEIDQSPSPCLRCQAQRCGAALDQCYGPGFHEGRSVSAPLQRRCVWNEATGQYDRDCTFGLAATDDAAERNGSAQTAGASPPAVPCGALAVCLQSCGCGADCTAECMRGPSDGGVTTYYSNDPRYASPACSDCLGGVLASCVKRSCPAECGGSDAGP
jgi:hypothetical protein